MILETNEVEHFCELWKEDAQLVRDQFPTDRLLWVNYEELVSDSSGVIEALQEFTGAENIDVAVMEKKINTFDFDPKLQGNGEGLWLRPRSISEEIKGIIDKYNS